MLPKHGSFGFDMGCFRNIVVGHRGSRHWALLKLRSILKPLGKRFCHSDKSQFWSQSGCGRDYKDWMYALLPTSLGAVLLTSWSRQTTKHSHPNPWQQQLGSVALLPEILLDRCSGWRIWGTTNQLLASTTGKNITHDYGQCAVSPNWLPYNLNYL